MYEGVSLTEYEVAGSDVPYVMTAELLGIPCSTVLLLIETKRLMRSPLDLIRAKRLLAGSIPGDNILLVEEQEESIYFVTSANRLDVETLLAMRLKFWIVVPKTGLEDMQSIISTSPNLQESGVHQTLLRRCSACCNIWVWNPKPILQVFYHTT